MDISEALRYAGVSAATPALLAQAQAVAAQITERPRYVYRLFSLEGMTLPELGLTLPGNTARKMLASCHAVILLSCTLGLTFHQRLRAMEARDMAQALLLDGYGSALVEEGCDQAEAELAARFPHLHLTDRFSPGYGDLPLSLQKPICQALDVERRLGISLSDTMLMTPEKSVTALIGLSHTPQMARIRGCGHCARRQHCQLRQGGHHCGL